MEIWFITYHDNCVEIILYISSKTKQLKQIIKFLVMKRRRLFISISLVSRTLLLDISDT